MMNYIKSENYRLLRKKNLYVTISICFFLITAAAFVLYLSQKADANFSYATSLFLYSNVISSGILILIVAFLFNLALTGKDHRLIKQSISFGISRDTIFWSKLAITLSYFLMICSIGLALTIGLGELLLASEPQSVSHLLIASFNMLPIILSGFFLIHTMKMLGLGDIYVIISLFLIYVLSGDLLRLIPDSMSGISELYKYVPSTLLTENLMNYINHNPQFDDRMWLVGIVMSIIFLIIGATRFAKINID